jgi:hypothetical protein
VPLATRARTAIAEKLSPEGTRRPTLFERYTVQRLPWRWLVRLNRWFAVLGKTATFVYCTVIAAFVVGLDPREVVRAAVNSGKPLEHVVALSVVLVTLIFILARSLLGWLRWKLQRELWRRDVERLSA